MRCSLIKLDIGILIILGLFPLSIKCRNEGAGKDDEIHVSDYHYRNLQTESDHQIGINRFEDNLLPTWNDEEDIDKLPGNRLSRELERKLVIHKIETQIIHNGTNSTNLSKLGNYISLVQRYCLLTNLKMFKHKNFHDCMNRYLGIALKEGDTVTTASSTASSTDSSTDQSTDGSGRLTTNPSRCTSGKLAITPSVGGSSGRLTVVASGGALERVTIAPFVSGLGRLTVAPSRAALGKMTTDPSRDTSREIIPRQSISKYSDVMSALSYRSYRTKDALTQFTEQSIASTVKPDWNKARQALSRNISISTIKPDAVLFTSFVESIASIGDIHVHSHAYLKSTPVMRSLHTRSHVAADDKTKRMNKADIFPTKVQNQKQKTAQKEFTRRFSNSVWTSKAPSSSYRVDNVSLPFSTPAYKDIHVTTQAIVEDDVRKKKKKKKIRKSRKSRKCSIVKKTDKPPKDCLDKNFRTIYDKLYIQDKTRPTKFTPKFVSSDIKKITTDLSDMKNTTDADLVVAVDLIDNQAKNVELSEELLALSNQMLDSEKLPQMKEINKVKDVGVQLLTNIDSINQQRMKKRPKQDDLVYENIKVSGKQIDTTSGNLTNATLGKNDSVTIVSFRNSNATNIYLNKMIIRNINQLLPTVMEGDNTTNPEVIYNGNGDDNPNTDVDHRFINSNILSAKLMTEDHKAIHRNIGIEITLYHLKVGRYPATPVFWKSYSNGNNSSGVWSTEGCKMKFSTNQFSTFTCDHLTNFAILATGVINSTSTDEILSYITLAGIGISSFCEVLSLIIVCYVRAFTKRQKIILHLVGTMLCAQLIFIGAVERAASSLTLCAVVAFCLSYFYNASFMWMLNMAIHLFFCVTTKLMTKRIQMWQFCLVGYGIPGLIQVIGLATTTGIGYGSAKHCWLQGKATWIFIAPVIFTLAVNILVTMYVLRRMYGTKALQNFKNITKAKKLLKALLVLTPSLGLPWLFLIFLVIFPDNGPLQYLFVIANVTQGVFIFVVCVLLDQKVRNKVYRRLTDRRPTNTQ